MSSQYGLFDENIKQYRQYIQKNELLTQQYNTETISVRDIVKELRKETWKIAPYQRQFLYDEKNYRKASKIIETILLHRIIPPIIIQRDAVGIAEIVDGQQRVKSIYKYLENEFKLNLSEEDDELAMLNGYKLSKLPFDLENTIKNYQLTVFVLNNQNIEIAVKVFLDTNTQPVPVSEANLLMNLGYGVVVEKTRELVKVDSDHFPKYESVWRVFGGHLNKNGSIRRVKFVATEELDLRIFKAMLAFIDPIIGKRDVRWLRETAAKCQTEEDMRRYGLDKFSEISIAVDDIFGLTNPDVPSLETPFISSMPKIRGEGKREVFVEALVEVLYLGLWESISAYQELTRDGDRNHDIHERIKREFIIVKEKVLSHLDDYSMINQDKDTFAKAVKEIVTP